MTRTQCLIFACFMSILCGIALLAEVWDVAVGAGFFAVFCWVGTVVNRGDR